MSALETRWWVECGADCELNAWDHKPTCLWDTQTANQAVGTGFLVGVPYRPRVARFNAHSFDSWAWGFDRAFNAPKSELSQHQCACCVEYVTVDWGSWIKANQSARIAFGAL